MHRCSVFKNSCLRLPVDPISKMPKTAYERKKKPMLDQCSIESPSTVCSVTADAEAEKLKDFYRSIPDYSDINHLPEEEFYSTLKTLRERKKKMFNLAVEHIDCNDFDNKVTDDAYLRRDDNHFLPPTVTNKKTKSKINHNLRRQYSDERKETGKNNSLANGKLSNTKTTIHKHTVKKSDKILAVSDLEKGILEDMKVTPVKHSSMKEKTKSERPKRNHSACSITWNDEKLEKSFDIDEKFDHFFEGKKYSPLSMDDDFKTQSMPSSPLRTRRAVSPVRRNKNITIPKPFKMTER